MIDWSPRSRTPVRPYWTERNRHPKPMADTSDDARPTAGAECIKEPDDVAPTGVDSRSLSEVTNPCPRCGARKRFLVRYPVLTISQSRRDAERNRMRYDNAWVCSTRSCDYREPTEPPT